MGARTPRRLAAALASALLAGALVAGCSSDANSIAEQAKAGDRKGYVSGDGSVEQVAPADRGAPVTLTGTLLDGGSWSAADHRGSVVIINVWGSWCAPCVAEAPDLVRTWKQLEAKHGDKVAMLGINFREGPAQGRAFATKVGMTYPNLSDTSGVSILSLQGKAPTVPTTLVLDTEGRIAARVGGTVTPTVLTGLVDDVLASS